ncbi:MAG: hypothetical protein ACI8UQ_000979, partial [Bacteroidia bacterium]
MGSALTLNPSFFSLSMSCKVVVSSLVSVIFSVSSLSVGAELHAASVKSDRIINVFFIATKIYEVELKAYKD